MRTQRMNSTQREMRTTIEIEANDGIKESHKENGKGKGKEKKKGRDNEGKGSEKRKGDVKTKTETERENKGILRHIKHHKSMLSLNLTDFTRPENRSENRK